MSASPIPIVLVVGAYLREGRSLALEKAEAYTHEGRQAVIIEGGPGTLSAPEGVQMVQLAAGCVCCVGQLPLRVTIARMIRQARPARLWIEVSDARHLPELRRQLNGPGFAGAVQLVEGGAGASSTA